MECPSFNNQRFPVSLTLVFSSLAIALSLLALIGWLSSSPWLTALWPGGIPMAPSTALLFLLNGSSLLFWIRFLKTKKLYTLSSFLAWVGIIIAALLLVFSSYGIYLQAEYLGMNISGLVGGAPIGHMSPLTALCFVMAGMSLLFQHHDGKRLLLSFWLVAVLSLVSLILIVGYLVGAPLFYGTGIIPPAMTTSLAFLMLGIALLSSASLRIWQHSSVHDDTSAQATIVLILVFMLTITGILSAGYFYSRNLQKHFHQQVEAELRTIADLKINDLQQWRQERLRDASLFFENASFSDLVSQYFTDPDNLEQRGRLQTWLQSFQKNSEYDEVFLVNIHGIRRLSVSEKHLYVEDIKEDEDLQFTRLQQITFLDFDQASPEQKHHLEIVIPIRSGQNWENQSGALVLSVDPERYLYSMIKRWPTPSKTAESLLVRRDGKDVLFLNDLRFIQNAACSLRFPLTKTDLPAVMAVQGKEGVVQGADYRKVPVMAVIRKVSDSPWFLVAKIDLDEINQPLYERLLWITGLIGALLLGSGAIIGFIWRNQRAQFYRVRYLATRAVEDSEKRLMIIFESGKDGIMVADVETKRIIVANLASCEMLGYSRDELLAMDIHDIHPEERMPLIVEKFEQQARGEISIAADVPMKRKDGSVFYADINTTPITFGDRACLLGTFKDITDRMQAAARIEHLNRVLRAIRNINQLIVRADSVDELIRSGCNLLVDHGSYGRAMVILTDPEGNPTGHMEAGMGGNFPLLVDQIERGEMPACCKAADAVDDVCVIRAHGNICKECVNIDSCVSPQKMSIRLRHQDTLYGYLVVSLNLDIVIDAEEDKLLAELAGDLAYSLHNMEIKEAGKMAENERDKLQNQLIQAQKMESVGRLAGGVAHDYNNMLSVILGFSELALEKVDPADPLHEDLSEIHKAGIRSMEITRQLLAFARKQTIVPVVLDLNESVESMFKMLRRLIGEDIDLAWLPQSDLWSVKMDPSQIDQMLANLCVNSRDAIDGVGRITIETGMASFNAAYCADHPGFVPGDYVLLAVSDDGCGMDLETIDKIFEPFFTTKAVGQGTGLGLATVYGIVKQNQGFINVYSEPGKGTTFKIYLARHAAPAVDISRESPAGIPKGHGEIILVVEDEGSILKLAERILVDLGYTVLTAQNPNQALSLASERPIEIDLLITDVVMPEMNGKELSNRLHGICPRLKTLFMSGYTANVIAHRGVLDEGVHFITKPFSTEKMANKVKEALDLGGAGQQKWLR